jgi:hypothetical protein
MGGGEIMANIGDSVGEGGKNEEQDVLVVQQLLNAHVGALGLAPLKEDGVIGIRTNGAIRKYQAHVLGMGEPDGRVDVGGRTWRSLAEGGGAAPAKPASQASGRAKWVWDQSAGTLAWNGDIVGSGYAGHGAGRNNPDMQSVVKTGPIPRGLWKLVSVGDSPHTGKFTIVLDPEPGTDSLGRSAFRIHGNNAANDASEGCIILDRPSRELIWSRRGEAPLIEVVE